VVCLRSEGTAELLASLKRPDLDGVIESQTLLRRAPTVADIANVGGLMASDQAGAMTATVANLSGGSVVD
jgi:3-oxoacyl-[acyl-carrier protein] reductase